MSLAQLRKAAQALISLGVSPHQFLVMAELRRNQPQGMSKLARACDLSNASATGAVDRLEKMGFVTRQHASDDRRKVNVSLTTNGKQKLAQCA